MSKRCNKLLAFVFFINGIIIIIIVLYNRPWNV